VNARPSRSADLFAQAPTHLPVARAAGGDGSGANALHEREQLGASLLHEHLAEESSEQLDLAGERITGTGGSDRPLLGVDGGIGGSAPRHALMMHERDAPPHGRLSEWAR